MRLAESTIAELTRVIRGYDVSGDVLGSYIAGSVAEGYANSTSDIDIVVVTQSAAPADTPQPAPVGGRPVEVEHVPVTAYRSTPHTDEERLNGLRIGIPLIGHRALAELRNALPWSAIRRNLLATLRQSVHDSTEDAEGAIADGALYAARCCSRLALDASVDALTVGLGDLSVKPKWRMHRIHRLDLSDVGEMYLRADLEASPDGHEALAAARTRLALAHSLLSHPALKDA